VGDVAADVAEADGLTRRLNIIGVSFHTLGS
jgi:hypothetical protein